MQNNVQVARVIHITVPNRRMGGMVAEQPLPEKYQSVKSFVTSVFPGKIIEFFSNQNLPLFAGTPLRLPPSSLFFQMARSAFTNHYAFGIRPEVLLYLMTSVVAQTIRLHPEFCRHLFTNSMEKTAIHVCHDSLAKGNPNNPWHEVLGLFEEELQKHIPSDITQCFLPTLSTFTDAARLASLVTFMETVSPYYDCHTHTRCGIPRVVLFGQSADYCLLVDIAEKLRGIFEQHLSLYFEYVISILQKIAHAAGTGEMDNDFWKSMYAFQSMSGVDYHTGWLSSFLWYVQKFDSRSGRGTLVVKDHRLLDCWHTPNWFGISAGSEPSHVSAAPFLWHYHKQELPMRFIGGIMGGEVREEALTPTLEYGIVGR